MTALFLLLKYNYSGFSSSASYRGRGSYFGIQVFMLGVRGLYSTRIFGCGHCQVVEKKNARKSSLIEVVYGMFDESAITPVNISHRWNFTVYFMGQARKKWQPVIVKVR